MRANRVGIRAKQVTACKSHPHCLPISTIRRAVSPIVIGAVNCNGRRHRSCGEYAAAVAAVAAATAAAAAAAAATAAANLALSVKIIKALRMTTQCANTRC
mgnify:CR=1 FL=1